MAPRFRQNSSEAPSPVAAAPRTAEGLPLKHHLCRMRLLALAALLLLTTACSLPQLAYNNADWLLLERIDDFVELTLAQRAELSNALEVRLERHRTRELPDVAEALDRAATLLRQGLDLEGARWLVDAGQDLARQTVRDVLPDLARTLAGLDREQRRYLRQRLAESISDMRHRYDVDRPLETRVEGRIERTVEYLEELVGELSDDQRALVAQYVGRMPDSAGAWIAYLKARHAKLLERLERGDPVQAISARLRDSFVDMLDIPPPLKAMRDQRIPLIARMLLAVDATLDSAQRAHAVERFESLRDDVLALIAEANG